jgi:hypothetical protein
LSEDLLKALQTECRFIAAGERDSMLLACHWIDHLLRAEKLEEDNDADYD